MTFKTKLAASIVGLTIAAAPFAMAADKDSKKAPAAAKPAPKSTGTQPGMVVVKDPVTGELRAPTAAEFQTLTGGGASGTSRTSGLQTAVKGETAAPAAAVQVQRPDGSYGVVLDESHSVFAVATRTPDGKLKFSEVTGAKAAEAAVANAGKKTVTQGKAVSNNDK
jgi:hypothetical protein